MAHSRIRRVGSCGRFCLERPHLGPHPSSSLVCSRPPPTPAAGDSGPYFENHDDCAASQAVSLGLPHQPLQYSPTPFCPCS